MVLEEIYTSLISMIVRYYSKKIEPAGLGQFKLNNNNLPKDLNITNYLEQLLIQSPDKRKSIILHDIDALAKVYVERIPFLKFWLEIATQLALLQHKEEIDKNLVLQYFNIIYETAINLAHTPKRGTIKITLPNQESYQLCGCKDTGYTYSALCETGKRLTEVFGFDLSQVPPGSASPLIDIKFQRLEKEIISLAEARSKLTTPLSKALATLKEESSKLTQEVSQNKIDQAEIARLTTDSEQLATIAGQFEELNTKTTVLENSLLQITDLLQKRTGQHETAIKEKDAQIAGLENQVEHLTSEFERHTQLCASLQDQIQKYAEEKIRLSKKMQDLRENIDLLNKTNTTQHGDLDKITQLYETAMIEHNELVELLKKNISTLEEKLTSSENEIIELKEQLQQAQIRERQLNCIIEENTKEIKKLQEEQHSTSIANLQKCLTNPIATLGLFPLRQTSKSQPLEEIGEKKQKSTIEHV